MSTSEHNEENLLEPDSQIENPQPENEENEVNDVNDNQPENSGNDQEYELSEKNSKILNEYHKVYTWLDTFKFSKPKKNLTRDFSDGFLFVELLLQTIPKVIEQHNVSPTLNTKQKYDNWGQIQKRMNSRTYLHISSQDINEIVTYYPYAIEKLIERLMKLIEANKILKKKQDKVNINNKKHYMKSIDSKVSPIFKENATFKSETKEHLDDKLSSKEEIFKSILEEKDNKLYELQTTLELLVSKIKNLEEDNFKVEEMIIRYRNKLGKSADYAPVNQSNNDSSIII